MEWLEVNGLCSQWPIITSKGVPPPDAEEWTANT